MGEKQQGEAAGQAWFDEARFGLFVHWGAYSARGLEPSWPLVGGAAPFPHGQDLAVGDYFDGFDSWCPPEGFADDWAARARAAGMRYAVLTTKHHDGFTLFPTETSPRGVHVSAPGRDLVGEFVEAMRGHGLRVGLYYSLPDWGHPDYPAFTDEMRPYPLIAYPRPEPDRWERFLAVQQEQLDHLLTAYGQIDVLWFDGGWERTAEEWRSAELVDLIRQRQPDLLVNDRLTGAPGYATPEQAVPVEPPEGRWEACLTMAESWGNVAEDPNHKSARTLLEALVGTAGAGGNLLLNVSPDGDGMIPAWQADRLATVGDWVQRHHEAIFGTTAGLKPWQFFGPSTRRPESDRTYLFCTMRPQEHVVVRGLYGQRLTARALGTGAELEVTPRPSALDRIIGGDPICDAEVAVPDEVIDPLVTVLELTQQPG